MTKYALIDKEGNVVQIDETCKPKGFVEIPDDVYCGMIKEGDNFILPKEEVEE